MKNKCSILFFGNNPYNFSEVLFASKSSLELNRGNFESLFKVLVINYTSLSLILTFANKKRRSEKIFSSPFPYNFAFFK